MLTIIQSKTYNRNQRHAHDMPTCVICGKGIKAPRYHVHVHYGGGTVVTESEAVTANLNGWASGDLYFYPIGSDCLAKHPEYLPYVQ